MQVFFPKKYNMKKWINQTRGTQIRSQSVSNLYCFLLLCCHFFEKTVFHLTRFRFLSFICRVFICFMLHRDSFMIGYIYCWCLIANDVAALFSSCYVCVKGDLLQIKFRIVNIWMLSWGRTTNGSFLRCLLWWRSCGLLKLFIT